MFKFTKDIEISVNLLSILTDQPIKTTEAAEKCGTSVHMMNLITSKLRRAGLIKTQKGRNGGISANRKNDISTFEVISVFYNDPSAVLSGIGSAASKLNGTVIDFFRALPITGIPYQPLSELKRHEELVGDDEYSGEEIIFEDDFDLPQNKAELSEGVTAIYPEPDYVQPIVVSLEAFEQIQKELESPSEPSETLKEAMKDYKETQVDIPVKDQDFMMGRRNADRVKDQMIEEYAKGEPEIVFKDIEGEDFVGLDDEDDDEDLEW